MTEKYERQMKKGILDLLVLKLLNRQPKYGYQLISELRDQSDVIFVLKEGTLYPILYRLEDDGLIESRWSEPEGKQVPRKYYAMTEKGKTALGEIRQVWEQIAFGVAKFLDGGEAE